jgi:hypothetical protein
MATIAAAGDLDVRWKVPVAAKSPGRRSRRRRDELRRYET